MRTPSARTETARLFDYFCRVIGLDNVALANGLRQRLGRATLSRPTIRAWREGKQAVPAEALWVAAQLAGDPALYYLRARLDEMVARVQAHEGLIRQVVDQL